MPVTSLPFDESERLLAIVRGQTNAAGDLLPTNRSGVDEDGTRASQYGLRFVDFMHSSPDATPEDCLMKKECMPVGKLLHGWLLLEITNLLFFLCRRLQRLRISRTFDVEW